MARPRKPTAKLILEGGFRSDRHAGRKFEPMPAGSPEMPEDLEGEAAEHWRDVLPQLLANRVATGIDVFALKRLCEFWAEACEAQRCKPHDRKRLIRWISAHKEWSVLASKFGLTPADRAKMTVATPETLDPMAEFVA